MQVLYWTVVVIGLYLVLTNYQAGNHLITAVGQGYNNQVAALMGQ